MRLLVVDDEEVLADAIAGGLRRQGHEVDIANDGAAALARTDQTNYDVVILDRDLPKVHGDQVCRELAALNYPGRIIMLTAATTVDDRVTGLSLGADDYLPKPFAFRELLARVTALGRRVPQPARVGGAASSSSIIEIAGLSIDRTRREIRRGRRAVNLTPKEYAVLVELLDAAGAWRTPEQLLETVWDVNADPESQAVKVTIARLRAKLAVPDLIESRRGFGYRLVLP